MRLPYGVACSPSGLEGEVHRCPETGIDTICIPKGNEVGGPTANEVRRKLKIIACEDVSEVFKVALVQAIIMSELQLIDDLVKLARSYKDPFS